jgi:CBS domain-containing protein
MQVKDIVRRKGRRTITIAPNATLKEASKALSREDIGALVVADEVGQVLGLLSERDIVRQVSERGPVALRLSVKEAMDEDPVTCSPDDSVRTVMDTAARKQVRYLPVLNDGTIDGIISVGDLLNRSMEEAKQNSRTSATA